MKHNEKDENDYLKDLETIKDVLLRAEDKPLFETWAFYVWGAGFITGTLIQYFLGFEHQLTAGQQLVRIWIPIMLILGLAEVVTLVRSMARQAITVFTKTVVRFYLALLGSGGALILIVLLLHSAGNDRLIPIVYIVATAIVYFLFSLASYPHLVFYGYAMLALGAVTMIFSIPHETLVLTAGVGIGVSLIAAGMTDWMHRRRADQPEQPAGPLEDRARD